MTRLPRSPDSTLVLMLNQETVDDFILLFLPPCYSAQDGDRRETRAGAGCGVRARDTREGVRP
jgi:hypothetical protein